MMKVIQFSGTAAPFELVTKERPQPKKGQILIKQRYSSINPADHKFHMRTFTIDPNLINTVNTVTPGFDVSGTVVEVGEGVTSFAVGDEVFGQSDTFGGGFAEYAAVSDKVVVKRTTIPAKEAGGSASIFGTAWFALFVEEDLASYELSSKTGQGKTIFIPGGGGGVGHMILQLAKKSGYKVITSASKPESIQLCKDCHADHVIDYSKNDVITEVLKLTNNEGVDVVVDTTYVSSSFVQSATVVKKGGKWICVANAWDDSHQGGLNTCKERGVTALAGGYGRYWIKPEFIAKASSHIPHMLIASDKLYADGIYPRVSKVITLYDAKLVEAETQAVGESKRYGKVIIEIGEK